MIGVMMIATALQAASPPPARDACPVHEAHALIDSRYDAASRKEAARIAGGGKLRWILPGTSVTQDFVPARLNVEVGDDGYIHRVYCG